MTDTPKLPGTRLDIVEKYPYSRRLDYPDFGEACKTTYASGVITDFVLSSDDPITLDGTCSIDVEGVGEFDNVPIFYHCRKGGAPTPPPLLILPPGWEWLEDFVNSFIESPEQDDGAGIVEDNGSLRRGAGGFWTGQEVKVLLQEGKARCVVGHMDKPHRCHNIFQIKTRSWFGDIESTQGFMCSLRRTYGNFNESPLKDQYNKNLNLKLTNKVCRLFGYREFQRGTIILFYGDWLIKMGPVMYIFQVNSIGLPGPAIRSITILAALYDEDLEKQAIATGKKKEDMYPPVLGGGVPHQGPFLFEDIEYQGFVKQTDFSRYMLGYYQGTAGKFGGDTPRWVYTEIYTEPIGYPA